MGFIGITLSVCPSVDRIVSALYLQQYSSDLFHICTSYQATSECVSRVMPVSKLKKLNHEAAGVSSERRRSCCSSFFLHFWLWLPGTLFVCFYFHSKFLISSLSLFFRFLVATKHGSIRPSVCLWHLFHYVPVIVSSWNYQELLPLTKVISRQMTKVRGQKSRSQRSKPHLTVSGLTSSLNSPMPMKCCTKLQVA